MNEIQHLPIGSLRTSDERQMGMFLHMAGAVNAFAFPIGAIITIILWQAKKEEMPSLDAHGKMAVNWLISFTIYCIVSAILMIILVGFFLLMALFVVGLVFPILAGMKANSGELWDYPLTIKFLK